MAKLDVLFSEFAWCSWILQILCLPSLLLVWIHRVITCFVSKSILLHLIARFWRVEGITQLVEIWNTLAVFPLYPVISLELLLFHFLFLLFFTLTSICVSIHLILIILIIIILLLLLCHNICILLLLTIRFCSIICSFWIRWQLKTRGLLRRLPLLIRWRDVLTTALSYHNLRLLHLRYCQLHPCSLLFTFLFLIWDGLFLDLGHIRSYRCQLFGQDCMIFDRRFWDGWLGFVRFERELLICCAWLRRCRREWHQRWLTRAWFIFFVIWGRRFGWGCWWLVMVSKDGTSSTRNLTHTQVYIICA